LGLWFGSYQIQTQQWLRWWDSQGNSLLTGRNKPAQERQRAQAQGQRSRSTTATERAIGGILVIAGDRSGSDLSLGGGCIF